MSEVPKWAPYYTDSVEAARAATRKFAPMFRNGTMLLGLYAPEGSDPQEPHDQDEVYIIASGTAEFVRDGERVSVGAGEALFVPARMEHRFEQISDDFTAWVIFYGPEGGEEELPG